MLKGSCVVEVFFKTSQKTKIVMASKFVVLVLIVGFVALRDGNSLRP